jgi:hypothetical protein
MQQCYMTFFKRSEIMDWEDVRKIHNNFELSVSKTSITNYYSRKMFIDFPNNLPEDLKKEFSNNNTYLRKLRDKIEKEQH